MGGRKGKGKKSAAQQGGREEIRLLELETEGEETIGAKRKSLEGTTGVEKMGFRESR